YRLCSINFNKMLNYACLLYTSPSPRDISGSRIPSSACNRCGGGGAYEILRCLVGSEMCIRDSPYRCFQKLAVYSL
ncbi:hypothetical protein ACX3V1_05810, partial [Escherichia coli]